MASSVNPLLAGMDPVLRASLVEQIRAANAPPAGAGPAGASAPATPQIASFGAPTPTPRPLAAPQLGGLRQPAATAPEGAVALPEGGTPTLPAARQPQILAPRGTIEGDQAHRAALLAHPAALESIYGKIAHSNFGQAHPTAGKILGGLAQIPATVADIGLSAVAPRLGAFVPGTSIRRGLQIEGANKQIGEETGEREKAAQTQEAQARAPMEAAQAEEARVRTQMMPEQVQAGLAEHGLRWNDQNGKIEQIPEAELSEVQRAQLEAARNPWAKEAGNQPLGGSVAQLNAAMLDRYKVLNPQATALPAEFTLPASATKNDFDRLDKLMEGQERAAGTQAQQAESMKMREAMLQLATQRENESKSTKGSKWVTWTDKNGRTIAGPRSEAEKAGATDMADLQGQEIRDVQNARHAVTLLEKRGDPNKPETQGVLQLIDSLDKDGKLGVLASRFNRFATSGIGASPGDDPRIITLIDKGMLADTAAMQAHFGASGGRSPAMLQHFLDLANTGKMDGVTLRAGYKAIDDYMKDRGMVPEQQSGTESSGTPPPGATIIKFGDIK